MPEYEKRWDRFACPVNSSWRMDELADHSLGLVVEGGDNLIGVLFHVVKSHAADREIDDFMTVPRSRPG
jgi:hypothetical protein